MNFEQIYTKYGPMVLRRCRYLLKDEHLALDAMQEVFAQALKRGDTLKADYPSSLLYTMATNQCLNLIREKKVRGSGTGRDNQVEMIALYDEAFARFELRSLIDYLFKKQAPTTRTMATLHYIDGLTLEETAEVCGMSVSGVRIRLSLLSKQVKGLRYGKD